MKYLLYKNLGLTLVSFIVVLEFVRVKTKMNIRQVFTVLLFVFIYFVQCKVKAQEQTAYPDLVSAAANHHHGHGRVQIKVYRGPSEGHEHFAPHGYWVKQPADDLHHHH